jgi:hypothetical protein
MLGLTFISDQGKRIAEAKKLIQVVLGDDS